MKTVLVYFVYNLLKNQWNWMMKIDMMGLMLTHIKLDILYAKVIFCKGCLIEALEWEIMIFIEPTLAAQLSTWIKGNINSDCLIYINNSVYYICFSINALILMIACSISMIIGCWKIIQIINVRYLQYLIDFITYKIHTWQKHRPYIYATLSFSISS